MRRGTRIPLPHLNRAQMKTYHIRDIKTDTEIGRSIFEQLPNDIRPGWGGLILSRFEPYLTDRPQVITDLHTIIYNNDRWSEGCALVDRIQEFSLQHPGYQPQAYLQLAESVAKVTYNASGQPSPFESDCGWRIPSLALQAASHFDDNRLEEGLLTAILLFTRNNQVLENLSAAKDFLLYKQIDDILWYDWDPIGVNDIAPRDEYQSYVPQIYQLKKSGADAETIANRLLTLENDTIGVLGNRERCREVAQKIVNLT